MIDISTLLDKERHAERMRLIVTIRDFIEFPIKTEAFVKTIIDKCGSFEKVPASSYFYHIVMKIHDWQTLESMKVDFAKEHYFKTEVIIHLAKTLNRPEAVIEAINSHISSGAEDDVIFHILRTVNKLYRTAEDFREYKYNTEKEIRNQAQTIQALRKDNDGFREVYSINEQRIKGLQKNLDEAFEHETEMRTEIAELKKPSALKVSQEVHDAIVDVNTRASAECCKKHEELAFRVKRYCEDPSHLNASIKAATPSNRYARAELGIMVAIRELHRSYEAKPEEKIDEAFFDKADKAMAERDDRVNAEQDKKAAQITEGKYMKGGVNQDPATPRPYATPQGMRPKKK